MQQLGKYTILEVIGKGGMGMVYKAKDPFIDREVAIKLISESAVHVPRMKELFLREAKSAGRLSHENIMIIYDVGEQDNLPYIVMEYLEGEDLRRYISENKFKSLEQKLDIAIQIGRGLEYAHQKDIVHRDVKPENIRIVKNGRVKIMDFGIARLDSETRTMTRGSIGTPRYMSPEQIRGTSLDHRTDIFSFGVVLYEMLCGNNPFAGEHVTTVIYKILHEQPEPIKLEDADTSSQLQRIVSKCLEKKPEERYADFAAVLQDLVGVFERFYYPIQRTGGVLVSTGELKDQLDQPDLSEEETPAAPALISRIPRPGKRLTIAAAAVLVVLLGGVGLIRLLSNTSPENRSGSSESITMLPSTDSPEAMDSVSGVDSSEQPLVPGAGLETPGSEVAEAEGSSPPASEEGAVRAEQLSEGDEEVSRLSTAADQARRNMLAQKTIAQQAGAANNALSSYQQAQRREQDGTTAQRRQDFEAAQAAYSDAERLYANAARSANRRAEADRVRQAVSGIQQQMAGQRGRSELSSLFQQAEAQAREARQLYEAEDFEGAARSFQAAADLYTRIQQRTTADPVEAEESAAASTGNRSLADEARSTMQTAKEGVGADQRGHPSYLAAVDFENQGNTAYESMTFDSAASYYGRAKQLFEEVADLPTPAELAQQSIAEAVGRLKNSLELEDADALHAFSSYFVTANWSAFFRAVEDVTATIETDRLEVRGNTATVVVQVHLDFLNRSKNERQGQDFEYLWTLQRGAHNTWTISAITDR